MPPEEFGVRWEVATDDGFRNVVRKGTATATPELGHSVHPEVRGLLPGKEYFYRFKVGPEVSPVGRTKTAPASGSAVDRLTFALASCQAWAGGPYAAYRNMALEDLDLVVHVGDYTYEGRDTETLADFRLIHARYKTSWDGYVAARDRIFDFLRNRRPSNSVVVESARPTVAKRFSSRPRRPARIRWRCRRSRRGQSFNEEFTTVKQHH
jgi:phosphodiesterase/alkaline phosphatase D-like protein